MRLRLMGFIILVCLLVACQPAVVAEPFVMHPLDVRQQSEAFETSEISADHTVIELYPPPPPIDRYPADGVRGMYLSAYGAANQAISAHAKSLLQASSLNAVVIDYKDDWGRIASHHTSSDPVLQQAVNPIYSAEQLVEDYRSAGAYTIARIVCFKDAFRSQAEPSKAMQNHDGSTFIAPTGDSYLNPFDKSNWGYLVSASIEAAKAGFDEIQFDYVRFPENFNALSSGVKLDQGEYAGLDMPEEQKRSQVIADFVAYAKQRLTDYSVRLSVDIFGYVALTVDDGNVGQNFLKISQQVDVISSMIYPSHWENGAFGAARPDKEPGKVVSGYIAREKEILATLEAPPISRPWLQSFTASYLGSGNYIPYTAAEVQAQIEALRQAGIREYLLWDPTNNYLSNVDY